MTPAGFVLAWIVALAAQEESVRVELRLERGGVERYDGFGVARVSILDAVRIGRTEYRVAAHEDRLEVDTDGDGEVDTTVAPEGGEVRFGAFGWVYVIRVGSWRTRRGGDEPSRTWWWRTGCRLVGDGLGGFEIVDANGNGVFGDYGEDLIVPRGAREPMVFEEEMEWRGRWYHFNIALDRSHLYARQIRQPRPRVPRSGVVAMINAERVRHALPPVVEDADLSRAAAIHARYLARRRDEMGRINPHQEDRGASDYTEEGDLAARNSYIGWGHRGPMEFFLGNLRTFYHRIHYFAPDLRTVGVAHVAGITVIDVGSGGRAQFPARTHPIVIPADGARDVPVAYEQERPDASRDGRSAGEHGMPIQAIFPIGARLEDAQIFVETEGGLRVAGRANLPGQPLVREFPMEHVVGFVPDNRLRPNTVYIVTVECRRDGRPYRWEWSFRTAEGP
jgi:hypothetical protein